ncbi:hypothetical protein CCACVL1_10142 [Corchorus capsularis]|uniref:CDC20/Fizzy WD40 domain-containing protein n=1 Tax=Corchorus capsularis TaxID=210143 RepID=A0A1R3ISG0_COCAP|nr:hypothetical protein CCACVL1_10142 [Corchorus capsularis]
MDRFIPIWDLDYARSVLTPLSNDTQTMPSLSSDTYRQVLAEVMNMNNRRILSYKKKPYEPVEYWPSSSKHPSSDLQYLKLLKPKRHIPQSPDSERDAPGLVENFGLNLLDWGSANVLAIALGNSVYLWDTSGGNVSKLVTVDDEIGPVTSLSWAPDRGHIAIGLNNSEVQLWDGASKQRLSTIRGYHKSRVGSMDWNNHNILTTGGRDGKIVNTDVRIKSGVIGAYRGHKQEVCGLRWSASGEKLASGGEDKLVHLWDMSMASSNSRTNKWLHRLKDHTSAVRALAWCPFLSDLLATGGGGKRDRKIKFWSSETGECLKSLDTGSEVCALLWNKNERELLSSHGSPQNQLVLWTYPSMFKIAELYDHTSRVLYMTPSPDGCTVATAAGAQGHEKLNSWNVFGDPKVAKPAPKVKQEPFARVSLIRKTLPYSMATRVGGSYFKFRYEVGRHWWAGGKTAFNKNWSSLFVGQKDAFHELDKFLIKIAELTGHTSRVLYMTQSPDGCTVATAAGDETLKFWNV